MLKSCNIKNASANNKCRGDFFEKYKIHELIEKGKIKLYSALAGAKVYVDDVVRIITTNSFGYKLLTLDENAEVMAQILYEKYKINKNIILELKTESGESVSKIEKIFKDNNIEYTKLD